MDTYTKLNKIQFNNLLLTAEIYHMLGYSVIPTRQKVAAVEWKPYQSRRPSLNQCREWFTDDDYSGLAIITGRISSLAVLDFDDPEQFRKFKEKHRHLAETRTVKTRRGYHLYYTIPPTVRIASRSVPGIDLQFNGKYVIAPPSIVNGHEYTIVRGGMPKAITQAEADQINHFLNRAVKTFKTPLNDLNTIPNPNDTIPPEQPQMAEKQHAEPSRNNPEQTRQSLAVLYRYTAPQKGRNHTLFQLALLGRDNGLTQQQVTETLADIHACYNPGKESYEKRYREALNTIKSAFSRAPRKGCSFTFKEPKQLPNTVREKLFLQKMTYLVRTIEALRLLGITPGQGITKKRATQLLKGIVGRDNVHHAFNTLLADGKTIISPSPRTPHPAYGIAKGPGHRPYISCKMYGMTNSGINRQRGPKETLYIMPSNLELAEKLAVRRSTISDELTLEDLKNAKTTREKLHESLIKRRPGQYSIKFFSRRVGMSKRTIYRYNADNENIHSRKMYHNQPVFWNTLDAVIPAEIEYLPHPGVFLTDTKGKKYPPKRAIAQRLLAKKQYVTMKTQLPNYWWYGEAQMPFRLQVDLNAILDEMAEKTAECNRKHYKREQPTPVVAQNAPEKTQERPVIRPSRLKTVPGNTQQAKLRVANNYRQALKDTVAEDFAKYVYQTINAMPGDGRISLASARRMADRYGEQAIRRAIDLAKSRKNIGKPVGFISTVLRSS